jgi:hypothetical protein
MTAAVAGTDYVAPSGNITGNAATVTTNANLTGVVTSSGNTTAIADAALSIAKTSGLQTAIDGKVADAINDATTTVAPSQNAVFDALALKANLAAPTFTGDAKAVTATAGDNDVSIATTAFVTNAVTSSAGVPYTGATGAVNLGAYNLTVNEVTIGKGNGSLAENTVVGKSSMLNVSGNNNTSIGNHSMSNLTSGVANTAIGSGAGYSLGTGSNNITMGYNANMSANPSNSIAIGTSIDVNTSNTIQIGNAQSSAFKTFAKLTTGSVTYPNTHNSTAGQVLTTDAAGVASWTTPSGVTAVGAISGTSNANGGTITSGTLNLTAANATNGGVVTTGAQTFAGAKTFTSNGSFNGNSIGVGNASGGSNLAVGAGALNAASTGHRNTAIGNNAMLNYVGTGYDNNTSVGYSNLSALTTGSGNTSVGAESMSAVTTGTQNTSIGNQSLMLVTGSNNVGVGKNAGTGITTGSNNTMIGFEAKSTLNSITNATAIGSGAIVALSNTIQLGADGSPGTTAITNVKTSGTLTAGTVTYPNTHNSSAGQILTVNASGTSSWATPSATSMSGILPVANGGTGSATQNFVDLTTVQTVAGNKTFSNTITANTIVKTGGTSAQFLMADGSVSSGTPLLTEADIEETASAGQTSFALTQTPSSLSKVKMYINGIRISKNAYTISGSTLTYIPANNENYTITAGDRVQFEFAY